MNKVAAGVNQWGRASRQYGGQLHQIDRLKSDRTEAALFPQKHPKAPGVLPQTAQVRWNLHRQP